MVGLGLPAVLDAYRRLHTISRDKSMVLAQESSLRKGPEFNSSLFYQVEISVCGFEQLITRNINLIRA